MIGSAQIIQGNALELPLADDSVDLCISSPPYWSLRSYQDGGAHYDGQIGSEPQWQEFLDNLIAATREMVRVTKPSGSIFLNLGDKFSSRSGGPQGTTGGRADRTQAQTYALRRPDAPAGIPEKSLCLLPERFRIRCVDELGLICRAVIVWSKPNGLPESVTDRVRRSHEDWMHFTLQPRYFSAVDEIREPHAPGTAARTRAGFAGDKRINNGIGPGHMRADELAEGYEVNPLGKLPGSVWTIPTEPLQVPDHLGVDHFAAYPTEWPRRIIMGWSPAGVCQGCGEGRRPISDRDRRILTGNFGSDMAGHGQDGRNGQRAESLVTITGYACACPTPDAPTRPSTILDPFGGTGTTALVAKALGRTGISVDMSADYSRLAQWRVNDPQQLAKAARVPKPPHIPDTQLGFDLEGIA